MIFIVGGHGLVGSAIVNYLKENNIGYQIIQKENKVAFFGKHCNTLIYANGNAVKYKANSDPFFDFNTSVASIAEYVHKIKFKNFIHISTVDVYDKKSDLDSTKEDVSINTDVLDIYGYHKYLAENYVKKYCTNYLIFRLPGLVGKGLTKNPIFDYISKSKKVMISHESELNFIDTDFIAKTIIKILNLNLKNEIFNLASKNSLKIKDIWKTIGIESEYDDDAENRIQKYHINTEKIQKYTNLPTSEESIKKYYEKIKNNH
jgi:nucleoside-diphosphate-sugar epimerase